MLGEASLEEAIDLVDVTSFLQTSQDHRACQALANSLRQFGAVLIQDPRVNTSDSSRFLNMMERYFAQPRERKLKDARPHLFYQVGATPDHTERPRDNSKLTANLSPPDMPISDPSARQKDPKWRFFWRCGKRPEQTDFPELNAEQVVPEAFRDEWADTMDAWGGKLLDTILVVAEMLALGLGLPQTAISEKLALGPHLLAPTGADMGTFGKVGTTIAGYHYDLNILTIHGRARYPGLHVWTRAGRRIPVAVPEGCLLVQSGVQLEHLTAGEIQRGMHEVVVSRKTCEMARLASETGGSMWRVSSTLFAHVRSDAMLVPLGRFADSKEAMKYPPIFAGEQVANELKALELAS